MRFRDLYVVFGSILTLVLLTVTDPDLGWVANLGIGAGTINSLVFLFKGTLGCTLLYVTRKAMMDYPVADFEELGKRAQLSPEGAGYYAIAIAIKTLAFAIVIIGAFNV